MGVCKIHGGCVVCAAVSEVKHAVGVDADVGQLSKRLILKTYGNCNHPGSIGVTPVDSCAAAFGIDESVHTVGVQTAKCLTAAAKELLCAIGVQLCNGTLPGGEDQSLQTTVPGAGCNCDAIWELLCWRGGEQIAETRTIGFKNKTHGVSSF